MPNRILKEGICTNEQIDKLTAFEETFFYRLIVNSDDYGLFDARIPVLKAKLFTLRCDSMKDSEIEKALRKLVEVGLAELYKVEGKPYVHLTGWMRNQQIRAKRSKYPKPEEADEPAEPEIICDQPQAEESACEQPKAEKKDERKEAPPSKTIIQFPLNNGDMHDVTEDDYREWVSLYPAVDVMQEFRNMLGWLNSNPSKRKTKMGIKKFINSWLAREQDKGGSKNPPARPYQPPKPSAPGGNPFKR